MWEKKKKITEQEEVQLLNSLFAPMGEYKTSSRSGGDIYDSHYMQPRASVDVAFQEHPAIRASLGDKIVEKWKECDKLAKGNDTNAYNRCAIGYNSLVDAYNADSSIKMERLKLRK